MRYLIFLLSFLVFQANAQVYSVQPNSIVTDNATGDAFSRLRVSTPTTLHDGQFTYGLQPIIFEQITNGSGAAISHDTDNRCAKMVFSSTPTGGQAIMQTYEHYRYQPSKSQLVFVTFNMHGGTANISKFAGYSDGVNGIEFVLDGTSPKLRILTDSWAGDQEVLQSAWNVDKLNGSGISRDSLDFTKTQILVLDFQALYVGRVRVGFDIDGVIRYAHEFTHANKIAFPYIQTANLPIRAGMTSAATVTDSMRLVCSAVVSEGGVELSTGFGFSVEGTATAASGARTHILSVRPKTTFSGFSNRAKIVLSGLDVVVTGNSPVLFELVMGQDISGTTTFGDVNTTYSASEFNTLGTISGSPGIVIEQVYCPATSQTKGSISRDLNLRYPITLNAAGAHRSLGTVSVIGTGIGGASASRAILRWIEIR